MREFTLTNPEGCVFETILRDSEEEAIAYCLKNYTGEFDLTEYDEHDQPFEPTRLNLK